MSNIIIYSEWASIENIALNDNVIANFINKSELISLTGIFLNNNNLSESVINNILITGDSKNITKEACTIDLSGGTNSAPTGAGITAKNNLISRGYTVKTN